MSRRRLSHDQNARRKPPAESAPQDDGRLRTTAADHPGDARVDRPRHRGVAPQDANTDPRITAILHELAVLGRRIGRSAGDLARLADATRHTSAADRAADARALASAAADLAAVTMPVSQPPHHGAEPVHTPSSRRHRLAARGSTSAAAAPIARPARPRAASSLRRSPAGHTAHRKSFRYGPLVTSAAVHAAALAALSLLFLQSPTSRPPVILEFGTAEPAVGDAMPAVDLTPADPLADVPADAAVPLPTPEAALSPEVAPPAVASFTPEPLRLDAFAFEASVDPADTSAPATATAAAVGGTAGGDLLAEAGGGTGRSPGDGRGAGGASGGTRATSFFGRGDEARSICFLCDNSNSHRDGGFHVVLEELARAVDGLRPDQSFFVIFFSDAAYPLFHPTPAHVLAPATPDNKRRLRAWLETVEMCRGGQGIHDAVKLAGALEPDVVYLLTDGEMTGTVVDRVAAADLGTAVVHTLGIQQPVVDQRTGRIDADRAREQEACNRNLITIAAAHGGGFTPVIVPPPAAVLERLRPIARNRARGAVWGLKL